MRKSDFRFVCSAETIRPGCRATVNEMTAHHHVDPFTPVQSTLRVVSQPTSPTITEAIEPRQTMNVKGTLKRDNAGRFLPKSPTFGCGTDERGHQILPLLPEYPKRAGLSDAEWSEFVAWRELVGETTLSRGQTQIQPRVSGRDLLRQWGVAVAEPSLDSDDEAHEHGPLEERECLSDHGQVCKISDADFDHGEVASSFLTPPYYSISGEAHCMDANADLYSSTSEESDANTRLFNADRPSSSLQPRSYGDIHCTPPDTAITLRHRRSIASPSHPDQTENRTPVSQERFKARDNSWLGSQDAVGKSSGSWSSDSDPEPFTPMYTRCMTSRATYLSDVEEQPASPSSPLSRHHHSTDLSQSSTMYIAPQEQRNTCAHNLKEPDKACFQVAAAPRPFFHLA